jgi:hypothetical protein
MEPGGLLWLSGGGCNATSQGRGKPPGSFG